MQTTCRFQNAFNFGMKQQGTRAVESPMSRFHSLAPKKATYKRRLEIQEKMWKKWEYVSSVWFSGNFGNLQESSEKDPSPSHWLNTLTHTCLFLGLSGWCVRRMISFDSSYCSNPKQQLNAGESVRVCLCMCVSEARRERNQILMSREMQRKSNVE